MIYICLRIFNLLLLSEEINHDAIAQNSNTIEFDAWTDKFKHWKESTSTSPSGLHLGHFKACTEVMHVQNKEQVMMDLEFYQKQQGILQLILATCESYSSKWKEHFQVAEMQLYLYSKEEG